MIKRRLGELLIERQLISVEQLQAGLEHQRLWGLRLGAALVAKRFISEGVLTRVLSEALGFPMVDLSKVVPDAKALELVPARVAEQYDVFPIGIRDQGKGRRFLLLAMADPLNMTAVDEIAFATGCTVQPAIAQISSLGQAVRKFYHGERINISPLTFERVPITKGSPAPGQPPMTPPVPSTPGPSRTPGVMPAVPGTPSLAAMAGAPPANDIYSDQPTGVFSVPQVVPTSPDVVIGTPAQGTPLPSAPPSPAPAELYATESIEERFWALMRLLARKGVINEQEYIAELQWRDRPQR